MRILPCLAIPALVFLVACQGPEYAAVQRSAAPVEVVVSMNARAVTNATGDDIRFMEKEFGAAIRARLANFVTVVPEGVAPPPGSARLVVEIERITQGQVSGAAAGAATGMAIGLLGLAAGDRDAIFNGLFWGLHIGAAVSDSQESRSRMLGYRPPRIYSYLSLSYPNNSNSAPAYASKIPVRTIIGEMRPLGNDERDYASINAEVVRAFARAVASHLQQKFDWFPKTTQSWYEPPERQATDEQ